MLDISSKKNEPSHWSANVQFLGRSSHQYQSGNAKEFKAFKCGANAFACDVDKCFDNTRVHILIKFVFCLSGFVRSVTCVVCS